jgi:hypothetical protein
MESMEAPPGELGLEPHHAGATRKVTSFGVSITIVLLVALFIVVDYSDVLFSESRRRAALAVIQPGMRLTQAERELNSAGYLTLYIEETPPVLQVSSLSRVPFTADLLHRIMPNSAPDVWLRAKLSGFTRFYVVAEMDGRVKFTPDGRVETFAGPEILL